MPFGDRTGPNGLGPMTGRGAGYCAGYSTPGYANPVGSRGFYGRGAGFGRGGGRGFGRGFGRDNRQRFYATGVPSRVYGTYDPYAVPYAAPYNSAQAPAQPSEAELRRQEKEALGQEASALEQELAEIKKRLVELGK